MLLTLEGTDAVSRGGKVRRSLPLAVQTDSDSIEHYWLDEVSTLSPAVLQRVLREAGIAAERLKLTGVSLEDHTVESISGYNSGLLLESDAAENVWQRDLVLEVLAGPNTGFVSPLGQLDDLAAALHDEHICEECVLLHRDGRLVLVSGRRRTTVELETPFVLGHSVVRISADTPPDVRTSASTPLKLAGTLSVPNRNYRYYLALALGPLLIGAVLIVFTKMWFFLLFGILSLVGGLIPYTQGRRAWVEYRTDLHQRWHDACLLHQAVFGAPRCSVKASNGLPDIHLTLGYGTQHPPLLLPRMPKKLCPALPSLQPVGVTLQHHPRSGSRSPEEPTSAHALRPGKSLTIEATAAHHRGLVRYLLSQLLPQLHGRTCWVRGCHGDFLQPELIKWLRFFPQLQFLDADNDSMNLRPGDVLISWNTTAVEPETDADLIHIIVTDAPEAPVGQGWNFDAHRRCLSFRGDGETHDGTAAASMSHLATTGHEQFLRNLQNLVRLTRDDGADQVSIESLPIREAGIESGLTACLGSDGHGPAREQRNLDLVADGPHLLIVGTTGSGKSVLLRRLTTEWVSRYCPTELNLVLVDFKGGATFAPFVQLPHAVAHLTDLDGENTPRLLTAIRTELKRREKLFASTGSQDYAHFRARATEPLPRIAVLIDEFAVFAAEQPSALDELIHLATIGRSLGFHLILATQRTGGHLSLGLRSNLSVKICLRVLSDNESHELIGTGNAAQLRPDQPGYAYIHTSGSPAKAFRVIPHRGQTTPRLRPFGQRHTDTDDAHTSELEQLLRPLSDGSRPVEPFLLPTLCQQPYHNASSVLAQLDLPAQKRQPWLALKRTTNTEMTVSSLAMIGHECTFLTTRITHDADLANRTILLAAAEREELPAGLAGYVTVHHAPSGVQMLTLLRDELNENPDADRVLIIEDMARWLSACEQHRIYEMELIVEDLLRISNDPRSNFRVLLQVDAAHGHHQLVNACRHRLYLPRGVAEQHRLLWPRTVNYTEIMGRGRLTGVGLPQDGALCQLLAPRPSSRPDAGSPCHRWSVLPERVQADESAFSPTTILLGTYGLDHRPLHRAASGLLAVIGPAASGKSTCCLLISKQHPAALIVDDLHLCNSAQLNDLQTILAHDPEQLTVVATTPEQLRRPQLSFLTGALQHGSHVLLRPTLPGHFDPFLVAPIPLTALPPGRGVLLQDGVATEFQLAQVTENVLPERAPQWPTRRSLRAREHSG